jgi:hypothetical protein
MTDSHDPHLEVTVRPCSHCGAVVIEGFWRMPSEVNQLAGGRPDSLEYMQDTGCPICKSHLYPVSRRIRVGGVVNSDLLEGLPASMTAVRPVRTADQQERGIKERTTAVLKKAAAEDTFVRQRPQALLEALRSLEPEAGHHSIVLEGASPLYDMLKPSEALVAVGYIDYRPFARSQPSKTDTDAFASLAEVLGRTRIKRLEEPQALDAARLPSLPIDCEQALKAYDDSKRSLQDLLVNHRAARDFFVRTAERFQALHAQASVLVERIRRAFHAKELSDDAERVLRPILERDAARAETRLHSFSVIADTALAIWDARFAPNQGGAQVVGVAAD